MSRYLVGLWLLFTLSTSVNTHAQDSTIRFDYTQQRINDTEVLLNISVAIPPGVELFALQRSEAEALYSKIEFDSSSFTHLSDSITTAGDKITNYDSAIGSALSFFKDSVTFKQKVTASPADSFQVRGVVHYMYRNDDEYLPAESPFSFFIQPEKKSLVSSNVTSTSDIASHSLWWIFLAAFASGIIALITPCVYSMIPVTVSFFTKRSQNKAEGIRNAIYYSVSIVAIFTILGFLITLIFGAAALNYLATNWIANLVFFAIFLVFGISFLGAFDIELPASWSTKADSKSGTKSFMGIFFMALTLVVVSFSCTGPIIGNLLVLAARGSYYGPLVGMFGFSLALALPFGLFAFFPGKLNVLGKAGGWLNAVKVVLGFLELALALKFLSNADLAMGWRLLDREVFLSLWIVIFGLLGLYLLGFIKFHHDDELPKNDFDLPYLSVTRLFFAIASFAFMVYMIPGLWGAPLKGISAFVPPMGTQDFSSSSIGASNNRAVASDTASFHPKKYYERMKMYEPDVVTKYGMVIYYDYEEALEVARKVNKPLMLDFTGINCVNCRKMEGEVWSDPEVMERLKNDFVIVSLYIDVHQVYLPKEEQYFSKALNTQVETLGDKNTDLQVSEYNANSQPYYFFLDGNGQRLVNEGYGYDPSVKKFIKLLDSVKEAYRG
ncbi:thioredoxin family protein [soil metagenome]